MDNVVEAFLWMETVDEFANGIPEGFDGPGRLASNQPLSFVVEIFNRVQVG